MADRFIVVVVSNYRMNLNRDPFVPSSNHKLKYKRPNAYTANEISHGGAAAAAAVMLHTYRKHNNTFAYERVAWKLFRVVALPVQVLTIIVDRETKHALADVRMDESIHFKSTALCAARGQTASI